MKEYGGYLEFENYSGSEYHQDALALNCGRNCLAYLVEAKRVRKIMLPYFLCQSVFEVCKKYGLEIEFYNIDKNFKPLIKETPSKDSWFYFVNYYGQFSNSEVASYKNDYGPHFIADYSQTFSQKPLPETDTLYTCRESEGSAFIIEAPEDDSVGS